MTALYFIVLCGYFLTVHSRIFPNNELFKLDIIHYNDFHARFEETSVRDAICKTNDNYCIGGFPRLHHEIYQLLLEKPDALVMDAGDMFTGTYWYTMLKWNVTQRFINMLHTDVHALGNHEFDDYIEGLIPYIKALKSPVVAANLDSRGTALHGLYEPYVVLERQGRKIGVIGVVTTETQTSARAINVTFMDPIPIVKELAQRLTDEGVDIIIVLSHCGIYVDRQLAQEVGEHVDVIVGGHTHSLLWNGTAPSHEQVYGPYPVFEESVVNPGHKVLIVTAACFSKYLGNLTVYFDARGDLHSFEGYPVFLDRSIPEDPEIVALLQPYKDELQKNMSVVVGSTTGDLEREICLVKECALGNLVADSMLNAIKEQYKTNLPYVAFLQSKNLRMQISKGVITRGDVINMSPFTNLMVTFRMTGAQLLEQLATQVNNLQVSGTRLVMNSTSEVILSAEVKEGDIFVPLQSEKEYQVSTLDFNMLHMKSIYSKPVFTSLGVDAAIIEDYITKISPVTPELHDRIIYVK